LIKPIMNSRRFALIGKAVGYGMLALVVGLYALSIGLAAFVAPIIDSVGKGKVSIDPAELVGMGAALLIMLPITLPIFWWAVRNARESRVLFQRSRL
jgi:hypothetical protein